MITPQAFSIGDTWAVAVGPLAEEYGTFSPKNISHTFIAMAPYHKNEDKNLLDKLDEACINFTHHAAKRTSEILRLVLIHVPETASLTSCKEWASQYFTDSPGTPVGAILLYQPTVARDINDMTKIGVYHYMTVVPGPQYKQWYQPQGSHHPVIPLTMRAGIVPKEPTQVILSGGQHGIPIDGKYIYQQGHHYIMTQKDEHGNHVMKVQNIASGIVIHAVGQGSQGEEFVVSGFFPPQDKLLLW
jgi:hypothetical protein